VYCIELWRNWLENTKDSVARIIFHNICSDGHFTTIGRFPYWSPLGSFRYVRLSPVTPCPPQLLQFVKNSSFVWQCSRTCIVICSLFWSCGMRRCEVWPCAVSSAVFISSENDTLKNNAYASSCFRLAELVQKPFSFQRGSNETQNWCRNLSAFREEAMRQTVVFDCSAESRNGVTSIKDAEYSWCLPTSRMYRNVEHIYGICN